MKTDSYRDTWFLMYSSLPDQNWARLRVFASGSAEAFDCDVRTTRFESEEEARLWLAEDEFLALEGFDAEDEAEFGIRLSEITPPQANTDAELKERMYVRVPKA